MPEVSSINGDSFNYNFLSAGASGVDSKGAPVLADNVNPVFDKFDSSSDTIPDNLKSDYKNNLQNKIRNNDKNKIQSNLKSFQTKELSPEAQKALDDLKQTDRKVKAHEMAHLSAGGNLVRGGVQYKFVTGPDGNQYAVAGEVHIDISADSGNLNATIQKMEQVKRAALAPSDPSPQDQSVASIADEIENEARREASDTHKTGSGSPDLRILKKNLDLKLKSAYQVYNSHENLNNDSSASLKSPPIHINASF